MNSFKQFVQQIKGANYAGANQTFAEIMQQKVADRLTSERQLVFKESAKQAVIEATAPTSYECLECGKKFKSTSLTEPHCPKCGSYDIDLAENTQSKTELS